MTGAARPLLLIFILLSILAGGASAYGSGYAAFLLSITCVFLVFALVAGRLGERLPLDRMSLALALMFVVYVALQLVPLPPALWMALPGRGEAAGALELLGAGEGVWLPMSADPARTLMSILSLLPALLVLILVAQLQRIPVRAVAASYSAVAIVSMILGILQVLGSGRESPLYVHAFTNWGLAVGFFANANHLATLLLASLPLSAALLTQEPRAGPPTLRLAAFVFLAAVTAIAMYGTASVAGMILWFPATVGGVLLFAGPVRTRTLAGFALGLALAGAFGAWLWLSGRLPALITTFGATEAERLGIARTGIAVVDSYWPIGSGLGTFEHVYHPFENPQTVTGKYVNHAHNDWLEWVIELGAVGVVLAIAGLVWWGRLAVRAWRGGSQWGEAAAVSTGLILAHSIVDYPLRTSAILVFFTLQWAVLCSAGREETQRLEVG